MGSRKEQCFLAVALSIAVLTAFAGCAPNANESSSIAAVGSSSTASAASSDARGTLVIEGGMAQPMLAWSDHRSENYTNEGSDILRYCVYVETDYDTDSDGKADLVKAFVQVPRAAAEGNYKAGIIYDPYPYDSGYNESIEPDQLYEEAPFDYGTLYRGCEKRAPSASASTLEAAAEADPADWNYIIPGTSTQAYENASTYNYFLVRGFAVVSACGIGTYGSEGFELCGMDLERDSHKCVVEWLTGKRPAYTDEIGSVQTAADWSNGNVAMTGMSYGGTLPFAVATTGVEGLKTIIPVAGIADWYEFTNSQGIPLMVDGSYTDYLAANNCGGVFTDSAWTTLKPGYGSYLWQVAEDENEANGDYAEIWDMLNYSDDYGNIKCPALVVQGLNDLNVTAKHADRIAQALSKAGQTCKLVLHQGAHVAPNGLEVNGELWEDLLNKWLCHYLYGEENGIENMAAVTVQSNVDGSWKTYDKWRDFNYKDVQAQSEGKGGQSAISSADIAEFAAEVMSQEDENGLVGDDQTYYISLDGDMAAQYELAVPEGATLFGVPEVHARLATEDVDKDGLMITAVLVDTADNGAEFDAFVSSMSLNDVIPVEGSETYEIGGGAPQGASFAFMQTPTKAKVVSYGWTDLLNPGCGEDSREYVLQTDAMDAGAYHDYAFYMIPTVYTLQPGHKLTLVLTTWDPYRAFLDEDYEVDPSRDARYSFYTYGYTVDDDSLEVRLPLSA